MQRIVSVGLLIVGSLSHGGCFPVALAGGVIAMSLADSNLKRQQASRRGEQEKRMRIAEQERTGLAAMKRYRIEQAERQQAAEAEIRKRAAQQQQQREEEQRIQVAAIEQQRAREIEQRHAADAEQQRRLAYAKQQRIDEELEQAAATEQAKQVLTSIEAKLLGARWSNADFVEAQAATATAEAAGPAEDVRRRLHLAIGLYAFLLDERAIATQEWRAARQMGVRDGRIVAAPIWTPGSIEEFNATK